MKEKTHNFALERFHPTEVIEAESATPSYKKALEVRDEMLWSKLAGLTVGRALEEWLASISNPRTHRAYEMAMNELAKKGLLHEEMSLQTFSMANHDATIDRIKIGSDLFSKIRVKGSTVMRPWSEATRQQRAAAFVSFTGFLSRRTAGTIHKATPCKEGISRTFRRIRDKVKTEAIQTRGEWGTFLKELDKINPRDGLLGKIMLQGGKRISEVLSLTVDRINYDKREITFPQAKTKGVDSETVITYPPEVMQALKEYIGDRTGIVFVTRSEQPLKPQHVERAFQRAGKRARISFKVTPHVLRTTCVTYLKKEGFSDTDIMKCTGHADSEMIAMYDKSSRAENASKKVSLV